MGVDYDEQKKYWEDKKRRRSPFHKAVEAFAHAKLDIILDALDCHDDQLSMLEMGAGNGYFSAHFQHHFDLMCLDFSANMLAMNPLPASQKTVGDAENLPFEDDSFDIVFCGNLLHHLEVPELSVREMKRVAKKHVVLIEPNALNPLMFLFGAMVKEERGTLKFTPGYVTGLGKKVGLTLRHFVSQGMVLPNKTPMTLLPLVKKLDVRYPLGFYHVAVFDV